MSVTSRSMPPLRRPGRRGANAGDRVFWWGTALFALVVVLIVLALAAVLLRDALPALIAFRAGFLISRVWNPVQDEFGALPFIYGTIVSSAYGLALDIINKDVLPAVLDGKKTPEQALNEAKTKLDSQIKTSGFDM